MEESDIIKGKQICKEIRTIEQEQKKFYQEAGGKPATPEFIAELKRFFTRLAELQEEYENLVGNFEKEYDTESDEEPGSQSYPKKLVKVERVGNRIIKTYE